MNIYNHYNQRSIFIFKMSSTRQAKFKKVGYEKENMYTAIMHFDA